MNETPNLNLPYLLAAQAQKHVTHNEAIRALDCIAQLSVLDRNLASPPVSPAEGDRYIIDSSPTGAWAGQAGNIAAYQDGAWLFYAPKEGWIAWVADEDALIAFNGSAWTGFAGGGGGGVTDHGALTGLADDDHPQYHTDARGDARYAPLNPTTLGINATADTTNRLAVASPASLFNHQGAGHQVKVNKNAAADTASFLFQTGFSGRAEIGTTGDDDFHFKVSANGTAWNEAIVIDRTTGACSFPNTSLGGGGGGGAPTGADYLVKTANAGLSSERVVTDTASVVADWGTGGEVKFNVPGYTQLMSQVAYTSMILADAMNFAQFPGPNAIADSFDALTYVDTAGATNLSTATAGVLMPSTTADTYATACDPNPATDGGSTSGYVLRLVIPAANLGANNGDKIRITFKAGSTGSMSVVAMYVGHKGASAPNFDGNQVQVTFNGGSATGTAVANGTLTSDAVTFAFDHTKDLVIAYEISGPLKYSNTFGSRYYKAGSGESANTTVSGYANDSALMGLDLVQIRTAAGTTPTNLTVASAALPFTDQPAKMAGHLLVKEVDAATPNADLFMDFSRDGGANWVQGTLALVRSVPVSGATLKHYATAAVDVSGQTYASPKYRLRTANNKLIECHAAYAEGS